MIVCYYGGHARYHLIGISNTTASARSEAGDATTPSSVDPTFVFGG
jgi:hypothetical protein